VSQLLQQKFWEKYESRLSKVTRHCRPNNMETDCTSMYERFIIICLNMQWSFSGSPWAYKIYLCGTCCFVDHFSTTQPAVQRPPLSQASDNSWPSPNSKTRQENLNDLLNNDEIASFEWLDKVYNIFRKNKFKTIAHITLHLALKPAHREVRYVYVVHVRIWAFLCTILFITWLKLPIASAVHAKQW
jgi:hypothetical protein